MQKSTHQFGGKWTTEKLERVAKYLRAYSTIMTKQAFRFAYIDAFAGTSYRTQKSAEVQGELLFPEFAERETRRFLEGSVRIALQVTPRFNKYIFIEKELTRCNELNKLKEDFPDLANDIQIINADANSYIADLCLNYSWKKNRAVLFLDPYGMEVEWNTIEAIASTQAIDLWLLFPLGVAVNRLLRRDGQIDESVKKKLDRFFGTTDWFDQFYQPRTKDSLFGTERAIEKVVNFEGIKRYFVKRLKSVFADAAENPLQLYNSKNNPLYLLCFAVGNKKGAPIAIKIAQDILKD
jgi:three-Cys-motif partner protein